MSFISIIFTLLLLQGACGKTIRLDNVNGSSFTSPNYPQPYPPNLNVKYYLRGPIDHVVVITFHDFKMEELIWPQHKPDYIELIEGKKNKDRKGLFLYGDLELPYTFISSQNRVWMLMKSDNSKEYKGFNATYKFVDPPKYCAMRSIHNFETYLICKGEVPCRTCKKYFSIGLTSLCLLAAFYFSLV